MEKMKVALIGVGFRGEGLYRVSLRYRKDIEIVAVCDFREERIEYTVKEIVADGHPMPAKYTDYVKCLDETRPEAVVIATDWIPHLEISTAAMERGIAVACEVGGAYNLDSLWEFIRVYERTKTPIMFLENCCYGRMELLALKMKRLGLLGKIVHCEGGYRHCLLDMADAWEHGKYFRIEEYIHRNCESYPTHEIGPIAKLLDINCGNRFVSLTAMGSGAFGLNEYCEKRGYSDLAKIRYNQSDIVTTVLKCYNGETVTITLDTTLPRYYSRGFAVHGTKGMICEENQSVYLAEDIKKECWEWEEHFGNVKEYYEKYDHSIWKNYIPSKAGHGGMDYLVFDAFFTALKERKPMPIDVYDMVTWMSITVLAEESMQTGRTVFVPDFTCGKWIRNKNTFALEEEDLKKDEHCE